MTEKPRRDRYRFPQTRDSRIAMVATLAAFLIVMAIFIIIIFRQGRLEFPTPTPETSQDGGVQTALLWQAPCEAVSTSINA